MLLVWILVFIVSLVVLVKGADWLLESAERIGVAIGLSPFIIGVLLVGIGTSFPEVISSLAAILKGVTEIVPANAVGSNIANILLVVGLSAVVGRKLSVKKDLINLDLPLLALSTALLVGIAWDGSITIPESVLLLLAYGVYLVYTVVHTEERDEEKIKVETGGVIESRLDRAQEKTRRAKRTLKHPKVVSKNFLWFGAGVVGLVVGAKYLIDSVIAISEIVGIGVGVITLAAVALGTSLPEVLVSIKAARKHKSDVALGNIFGSNVFNVLAVVGIPGVFGTLTVGPQTLSFGIPVLIVATILFIITGISKRIHLWEGAIFLLMYVFFIGKLFSLF